VTAEKKNEFVTLKSDRGDSSGNHGNGQTLNYDIYPQKSLLLLSLNAADRLRRAHA
jgi:hypothetical protein